MNEAAYLALRGAIVRCELWPGSWVKASELAERLDLGRTPTSNALLRLEMDGFTRPIKRKGWQITPITYQVVEDVFEAFELIAPGLTEFAVRNATDDELRTACDNSRAWSPPATDRFASPDYSIHPIQYLVGMHRNPIVVEIARGVAFHFERVVNYGLRNGVFVAKDYQYWQDACLDALMKRDVAGLQRSMGKLIDSSRRELERVLRGGAVGEGRTQPVSATGS